jgi:glutamate-ammonia-ligase adenylyltransferase
VQALQIVRGGREPGLRLRNTRAALAALAERDYVPDAAARALDAAYVFLREAEHRLQYRDDQQTQSLPDDPASSTRSRPRCAFPMPRRSHGARDAPREVARQFDSVFGAEDPTANGDADARWRPLWDAPGDSPDHAARLAEAGFEDPASLLGTLERVRANPRFASLPALSRERFDALVPRMIAAAAAHPGGAGAQATFLRLLDLLEAVARRSAYLALIIEHPPLLPRLATLMGASAWAADYLTRQPILLDELLDASVLMEPPEPDAWRDELARMMDEHRGDQESELDALRHFHHAHLFRLLAQDLAGALTVERLADHLSALADVILDATLAACWRHLAGADAPPPRFAIVGYGKLGGKELGYASDLDLVFLYDVGPGEDADAALARAIRLSQRVNSWLTVSTAAGQLYDTDLRLRPDGAKGTSSRLARGLQALPAREARGPGSTRRSRARAGARRRRDRRGVRGRARVDPAPAARPREARDRRRRDAQRMHAGPPEPDRPLRPQARRRAAWSTSSSPCSTSCSRTRHDHPDLTRNAGNIALLQAAAAHGPGARRPRAARRPTPTARTAARSTPSA